MNKILSLLIIGLLFVSTANAQSSKGKMIGLGMNPQMADYIARKLINVNTSGNTEIRIGAGKKMVFVEGNGTPVGNIEDGVSQPIPVIFTPSTSLTPTAVLPALSVLATAAPTLAAGLLPASPADGQPVEVYNGGASPFVVFAQSTPQVNLGGTSNKRINLAAKTTLKCTYRSSLLSFLCDVVVAGPTPAA